MQFLADINTHPYTHLIFSTIYLRVPTRKNTGMRPLVRVVVAQFLRSAETSPCICEARLAGQVVWITGASSGIGEALAVELGRLGARLVLSARREGELRRVKQRCVETGKVTDNDVLVVPLDSVAYDTHAGCVEHVLAHFGRVDILVNNSGRTQRSVFWETSLDGDRSLLDLDVVGQVSLTKAVLPHMMERGEGQIVVVSSLAGLLPAPRQSAYSGSKFALHGMFGALRAELHAFDINVLIVCPGPVESNITQNAMVGEPSKSLNLEPKLDPVHADDMSAARCARLFTVGMANRLEEIWIAKNPPLNHVYMYTYLPFMRNRLLKTFAKRVMKKTQ
ncbi:dehydrogenase/reductase SDR family member 7-like isoform X1 [Branchiostoma floridae x Branchiostoma belcheri]